MKKILAIVLAIVMIFSMSAIAFAADTDTADNSTVAAIDLTALKSVADAFLAKIAEVLPDFLAQAQTYIQQILASIGVTSETSVLGAVADLEAKIGDLGIVGDVLEYIENLINTIKQKIKDLYAGNKETTIEETSAAEETEVETTEAEEPAETGSTSIGIVAFAAVSVAAAAAYVCTKKKED